MSNTTKYRLLVLVLAILLITFVRKNQILRSENAGLEDQIDEYSQSLQDANANIEEANSIIEDAQGYAWSSYEDMGDALDNLSTVDTVSEP